MTPRMYLQSIIPGTSLIVTVSLIELVASTCTRPKRCKSAYCPSTMSSRFNSKYEKKTMMEYLKVPSPLNSQWNESNPTFIGVVLVKLIGLLASATSLSPSFSNPMNLVLISTCPSEIATP